MTNIVIVLTTAPDGDLADVIARTLVDERLAACVNIGAPMASVYRWEGAVHRDVERQLLIKTTAERVEAVRERVAQLHSYLLPELLVCPVVGGSPGYLDWVRLGSAAGD